MYQFELGCIKNVPLGVKRFLHLQGFFSRHSVGNSPASMYCVVLERATSGSDAGVEECKGYSPPNDHTTSASSTPLPLGSWDSNTGTRPTVSEARMARNRARYTQRTERQRLHDAHQKRIARGASPEVGEYGSLSRLHDAHQKRMPGVSWRQPLGGASPATGEYGLLHRDLKTRLCS